MNEYGQRFSIQIVTVGSLSMARVSAPGTHYDVLCNERDLRELSRKAMIKAHELEMIKNK